jgi:hypothetical protein
MNWLDLLAYFFGGAFLTNAIPHVVAGMMGEPFQSPFAKPRGEGLSSSTVNILWGFFNLLVGYLLVCRVGDFGLRTTSDVAALGLGGLLIGLYLARHSDRCETSTTGSGPPARWCPTSAPGCSAPPRTGWSSPSSRSIAPPPSAS